MTWNYRLVKKDGLIGIHSAYYNSKKEVASLSVDPEYLSADDADDLKSALQKVMKAFDSPVIDYNTFKPIGKKPKSK
jgi:hypothetical protein